MTFWRWPFQVLSSWARSSRMARLEEAVRAHLPLLPLVSAQLRDSNQHVEEAVSQVGASFARMVDGARQGVGEAARLLGDIGEGGSEDGQPGVGAALNDSRATLQAMLARFLADSDVARNLVERLGGIENGMGRIVNGLADVDKISFGNSILALNAKIEAAHIGDRGLGFEMVAQELWSQAQRSEEITGGMRDTVLRLARDARQAAVDIGHLLCADRARIAALQREVEAALERLRLVYENVQGSVETSGKRSQELAAEVAAAVQTLQFQDRVSQRILHIVDALESMQAALAAPMDPSASPSGSCQAADATRLLAGSYSMEREREIHNALTGSESDSPKDCNDVEIF